MGTTKTLGSSAKQVLAGALAGVMVIGGGSVAVADEPDGAEAAAAVVAELSPPITDAVEPVSSDGAGGLQAGGLTAGGDAADGIMVETESGFAITASLPDELEGATAEVVDGESITYATGGDLDLSIQATEDTVRMTAVLNSQNAPTEQQYTFEETTPYLQEDGSVVLALDVGEGIEVDAAVIEAPWAYDAAGNELPTHFRVEGEAVIQVVETDSTTVYPVVADPALHSSCGNITCTARFDRAATKKIGGKQALIGYASLIGSAFGGVAVGITGGYLALFSGYAGNYYNNGNCFALKFVPGGPRWAEQVPRNTYNCR